MEKELGPEWERIHEQYLHTLGNLTLTGYNSEYGYKSFKEKRDGKNGFATSTLYLNAGLGQVAVWNEDAIKSRANYLCDLATKVWMSPDVDEKILAEHKRASQEQSEYTLDNFPYLSNRHVERLFRNLRQKVLDLDEAVTEEIKKRYITYKVDNNFLCIVPLANSLSLVLNMKFSDLDDPQKMARDVSKKGCWGTGDIEIKFSALSSLPYVMGVIRQSLNIQITDDV